MGIGACPCGCGGGSPDCPVCCRFYAAFLGGFTSGDPRLIEFEVTISGAGEYRLGEGGFEFISWPSLNGTYTLSAIPSGGLSTGYVWNAFVGDNQISIGMNCETAGPASPQLVILGQEDGAAVALNFTNFTGEVWTLLNSGFRGGEAVVTQSESGPMPDNCCCVTFCGNPPIKFNRSFAGKQIEVTVIGAVDFPADDVGISCDPQVRLCGWANATWRLNYHFHNPGGPYVWTNWEVEGDPPHIVGAAPSILAILALIPVDEESEYECTFALNPNQSVLGSDFFCYGALSWTWDGSSWVLDETAGESEQCWEHGDPTIESVIPLSPCEN